MLRHILRKTPYRALPAATFLLCSLNLMAQFAAPTPPPAEKQPPAQVPGSQAQPTKNPDGTYTIRTSSRIVVLDVVVTDKKGKIVTGLTKDDFHVAEAGEPQVITNFEVGDKRLPDPAMDIESTVDLDKLAPRAPVNIILLDEFNTRFEDEAFARYSLKKFLEKQPDHLSTPTMLLAVSLDKFEVLRDYTQNKELLIQALDHHFVASPWRNTSNSWAAERYGTAFLTLRRVAEAVIGHQGHKNMIWIGRGFPALNMANQPLDATNRINNLRQDTVNTLRDARVTLSTIDPAGLLIDPGVYGSAAAFNDPFGGNYQFSELAKATGGRTIYGRNDVDAQIGAAVEDGTHFYTLVYRPTDTSRDPRKFRKIVVTTDQPNVEISTRQGYYLGYRPPQLKVDAPNRRIVSDLVSAETSTMVYDGVDMSVTKDPTPLNFHIHVAARSLGWTYATDTEGRHTNVVLLTSLFDKKGKELKHTAMNMKFGAPPNTPPTGRVEIPLNIAYKLDSDPKATRVRFVVRVEANGRLGTADVDLTEPWPAPPPVAAAPVAAPLTQ
jgi:VWFA-related protein